jgi:N-acetyl-anhydromuramyl-L-alanine amidase AmpD
MEQRGPAAFYPRVTGVPWDKDWFITDGYTPAAQVPGEWGVQRRIVALVIHDMEGYTPGAVSRFNGGAAGAHFGVDADGTVWRFRPDADVTWHAGTNNNPSGGIYGRTPYWRTHNINPYSVGIEIAGFAAQGYTPAQYRSVRRLVDYYCAHYGIPRERTYDQLAGIHDHASISANRGDPGPLFKWEKIL